MRTDDPESVYCEQLLQAQSEHNRFSFRRDYVTSKTMNRSRALFIQDLINRATMRKARRKVVNEDGKTRVYCLCTVGFLKNSLDWDRDAQVNMLKWFQKKCFVLVRYFGLPRRRYVWINIKEIEDAVYKRKSQSTGKAVDCPTGKAVDCPTGKAVGKKEDTIVSSLTKGRRTNAAGRAGQRSLGSFADSNGEDIPRPNHEVLAGQLYELLLRHHKVTPRQYKARSWSVSFRQAILDFGLEKVKEALVKYEKYFGDQYMVAVYAAKTFCENIPRILDCAERIGNEGKPAKKDQGW